jgi:predicted AAA+ superfamily ATPase
VSRREDFASVIAAWNPNSTLALDLQERKTDLPPEPRQVVTITGPRRAGKTYFMLIIIRALLGRGVSPNDILYLNFEHERLGNLAARDLEGMMTAYYEIASPAPGTTTYLFLDEIQNVEGWGKWVRRVHDEAGSRRIYLSGSSSKLLSREISTELRGRSIDQLVLPFSFGEFLEAKGEAPVETKRLPRLEERGRVLALLKEYLEGGGYPEVVLEPSKEVKEKLLRSYLDTVLYRDLIERFNVKAPAALETFVRLCVSNYSKYLSSSKSYNYLRGLGFRIRKQTVVDFLRFVTESYVIIPLEIYSRSIKNRAQYPKKVYAVDAGLIRASGAETSLGRLMENAVLVELARRSSYFSAFQVHYWKEYGKSEGPEVDFVIVKGGRVVQLMQVTYATSAEGVDPREVDALERASKELGCGEMMVLTWDYRGERKGVRFVPLWEWLLGEG